MTNYTPWTVTVHHDGSPRYVDLRGHSATLRLRADRDAPITAVFLRTCPDGEQTFAPLQRGAVDETSQWWTCELPLQMPATNYRFLIHAADGGWWLTAAGMLRHTPTDASDFTLLRDFAGAPWVQSTVFYQIFPDRFSDGDPSNNVRTDAYTYPRFRVVARPWGERPNPATGPTEFFGGDLQGIIDRLDYLADLGVNALYLNPIFRSPSVHKYDTEDYTEVDAHFGGNEALAALRAALDERGMRLILDLVPNHCGVSHPWFVAAQEHQDAPSAEFFSFVRHPDVYESWLGVKTLPKLNYRSLRLREVMYAGEEGIMRRWLRPPYRIDGWRLDVANMLARQGESQLGHKIGRGMRRAVKAENPEVYLMGENFYDGTPHLQGDQLDAVMNYRTLTIPLVHWLTGYTFEGAAGSAWHVKTPVETATVLAQWRAYMSAIPWQIVMQQFNLLNSHDTPRILTICGEDQAKARLAATVLFTFPGTPSVYYGEEIGLTGGGDPDCRGCMPWDPAAWNHDLRAFYQTLIQLRRTSPALHHGGFQILPADTHTLAYIRDAPEERIVVVARRAADSTQTLDVRVAGVPDGTHFQEVLSGQTATVTNGALHVTGLGAPGAQIWRELR